MNGRGAVAVAAGLFGVAVVYLAFVRTSPSTAAEGRAEFRREQEDLVTTAKREFAKVEMQPLTELRTTDQVKAVLEPFAKAIAAASVPKGVGSRAELLHSVEQFVFHRFANGSVDDYRAWRAREGYEAIPLNEMLTRVLPPGAYSYYTGKPEPKDAKLEVVFAELWDASFSRPGSRMVGIAKDERGQVVRFGELTKDNPNRREPAGGIVPAEVWTGGRNLSLPSWFRMRTPVEELVKQHGRAVYAETGIVVEFEGGARYPMVLTWFWDEAGRAWQLNYLNFYNTNDLKGFVY